MTSTDQPADHVVPTTRTPVAVYWYTGSRTIALSAADLSPLWTVDGTLGPGTMFAGQMLVPVHDGLRVLRAGERRAGRHAAGEPRRLHRPGDDVDARSHGVRTAW